VLWRVDGGKKKEKKRKKERRKDERRRKVEVVIAMNVHYRQKQSLSRRRPLWSR